MIKNYIINFIKDKPLTVTADQAANIAVQWQSGATALMINGNIKATHQIVSIDRVDKQIEKDLCARHNLEQPPRIEDYINNKQLK